MKAIEIKIENPEFLRICELAKGQKKSELEELAKETKDFKIVEMVSLTSKIQIAVTPAFYLAYQGEIQAVNFLESNFASGTNKITVNICEGYALSGDLKNLENYTNTQFADPPFAIGKFLALGQHWGMVFTLYHKASHYNFHCKEYYIKGLVEGLRQIIPVEYPQYLYRWLTMLPNTYKAVDLESRTIYSLLLRKDPFLREILAELSKTVSFNPLKLLDASQEIAQREGALAEKAVSWSMLYVWLWQGPKSVNLPTVIFMSVASLLCPEHATFLTQQMPSRMPGRLFQSKINLFKSTLKPMSEWMAEEELPESKDHPSIETVSASMTNSALFSSVVNPTILQPTPASTVPARIEIRSKL